MVAAMATFEGTPTGPADKARLVRVDLVPWLREYDGFRGVLVLTGEDKHAVITLWDTARRRGPPHRWASPPRAPA
jgi:hypothetical protein